jgi:hypothetical protein
MTTFDQPLPGIWEGFGVRVWLAIIAAEAVLIVAFCAMAVADQI